MLILDEIECPLQRHQEDKLLNKAKKKRTPWWMTVILPDDFSVNL